MECIQTGKDTRLKWRDRGLISQTIGEFKLKGHRYLIQLLTEKPNDRPSKESDGECSREICYFEIQGHYCMVLEDTLTSTDRKPSLADLLSERELQIATLVALGRVNKQIAKKLHISEWTVATYLRRIFSKLGVDSRAAMVYRCAPLIEELQKY